MIIACQQCKTRFSLGEKMVTKPNFLARCSKCGYIFAAYKTQHIEDIPFLDLTAAQNSPADRVIAVSNQKGGVAKTSTCLNVGAALALNGQRVLLVDFDVQANLTISLGFRDQKSFYDVVRSNQHDLSQVIQMTRVPNLFLLPSNKGMVLLNKKFFSADHFEFILKDRLRPLLHQYDYILIDTPPSVDLFTLNALTAASRVIIPCQCDYLSTHGVDQILRIIELIKGKTNPHIQARILITMYDQNSTASRLICTKIKEMYPQKTFETIIEHDSKIKEAQIMSLPVMQYDNGSISGIQYRKVADEVQNWDLHSKAIQDMRKTA
jgi:chromosome partitioning protein